MGDEHRVWLILLNIKLTIKHTVGASVSVMTNCRWRGLQCCPR